MKIQYFQSNYQWYFHIRARNGKIIAQSEGYRRKSSCLRTIKLFAPLNAKIEQVQSLYPTQ